MASFMMEQKVDVCLGTPEWKGIAGYSLAGFYEVFTSQNRRVSQRTRLSHRTNL